VVGLKANRFADVPVFDVILDGIQLMGNDKYCSSQIGTRIRGFTIIMGMNATI
jgi:hypothetical protein